MNFDKIVYEGIRLIIMSVIMFMVLVMGFGFIALLAILIDNTEIDLGIFSSLKYYRNVFILSVLVSIFFRIAEEAGNHLGHYLNRKYEKSADSEVKR